MSEANTTRRRQAAITLEAKPRQPTPLNPLNLLNPLNPHTEGVSSGVRAAPFLQGESVCLVSRLVQTAGDVVVGLGELVHYNVQGGTDHFGVEVFQPAGEGHVQEYIFIGADGVFQDGMMGVQVVQEGKEGLSGGALGGGAQMDAKEGVHAVVGNHRSHQLVVLSGGDGGHEDHGVVGIMAVLAAEEVQAFFLHVFLK